MVLRELPMSYQCATKAKDWMLEVWRKPYAVSYVVPCRALLLCVPRKDWERGRVARFESPIPFASTRASRRRHASSLQKIIKKTIPKKETTLITEANYQSQGFTRSLVQDLDSRRVLVGTPDTKGAGILYTQGM